MKKIAFIICIAVLVTAAVLICIVPSIDTFSCTMDAVSVIDDKLSNESYPIKLNGTVCKYLVQDDKLKLSLELPAGKLIKVEAALLTMSEDIKYAAGLYYDSTSNVYKTITILCDRDYTQFLIQYSNGTEVIVAKSDSTVDFQEIYYQLSLK